MPGDSMDALGAFLERLAPTGCAYMLVGAGAAYFYGYGRATVDFDFVIDLPPGAVPDFVAAFAAGHYCDEEQIRDALHDGDMFNVISHASGFKADFIPLKADPFSGAAFARRRALSWNGAPVSVISGQDLVLNKLLWAKQSGSQRQLADVRAILAAGGVELDDYFKHWLGVLVLEGELAASREAGYDA